MHGPQADSRIRAPAAIRSASAPLAASMVSTCRLPGRDGQLHVRVHRPALQSAPRTIIRSWKLEFVHEPISHLADLLAGQLGRRGTTLSGLDGRGRQRLQLDRSITTRSKLTVDHAVGVAARRPSRPRQ